MSVRLLLNKHPQCMKHPRSDSLFGSSPPKDQPPVEAGKEGQRGTGAEAAMGWSGPALWASGVSELRQEGATGAYDLDACGRRGLRDERAWQALRYISRSLVSARAVHHRCVQVETRLSQGGGSAASAFGDHRDLSLHLRACQRLEWREPRKRPTRLWRDQ
jgi:hypothetical protein